MNVQHCQFVLPTVKDANNYLPIVSNIVLHFMIFVRYTTAGIKDSKHNVQNILSAVCYKRNTAFYHESQITAI